MKRLLHIIASPRGNESRTLQVSEAFLVAFKERHPDWIIDELDLGKEKLPDLSMKSVSGKYVLLRGKELFGSLRESWGEIVQHMERFKTADFYLISTPMWNFHIPYMLKHYIDLIVQPKYLFRYKEDNTSEGLVLGKKMLVITSRGGAYYGNTEKDDLQTPYLKMIFGFIGITDISFINAESMDVGAAVRKENIAKAREQARQAGLNA